MRQLYVACITSVADYGVQIWWKGQKHFGNQFQQLQNRAMRKILGTFKSSPSKAMEIEAALPPPAIRFEKLCQNYALRLLKLPAEHPILERVSTSFPPFQNGIELDWNQFKNWNSNDNSKINPSQLFTLCSMIKDHFSTLKTETIEHSQIQPWKENLDTQIDLQVSAADKQTAKEQHLEILQKIKRKALIIYSDDSKNEENSCLEAELAYTTYLKDFNTQS
jgi:hypothetical protein